MSRIVIFANGRLSQPELLQARLQATDRIFCADGGTQHALDLGLIPDVIIGDFDSLSAETISHMEAAKVSLHRYPADKDQTDLELALALAVSEQATEIVLVTALGGRLDQMLANILLLTRSAYASVRLSLIDGPQWATLLRDDQSITIKGQPGDTLSLIPLSPTVDLVDLSGVVWPLKEARLSFGSTLTISNVLTGDHATVKIGAGMVLLVHFNKGFEEDLS